MSACQTAPTPPQRPDPVVWEDIPDLAERIRGPIGRPPVAQALICRWLLAHGAEHEAILVPALAVIGRDCDLSRRSTLQAVRALSRRGIVTVRKSERGPYARLIRVALPDPPSIHDAGAQQLSLLDLLGRRS